MQNLLINYLLRPLGKIMDHVNQKVKDVVFLLCAIVIASINCLHYAGFLPYRYLYVFAGGCLFLGVMILTSLSGDIKPVRFRIWVMIPWFIAGIFSAVSAILYSIDYLTSAVFFLIIYPVLFIVWNQGNFQKIMDLLVKALVIVLIGTILVNILKYPITKERYAGLFTNQNATAFFYTTAFACLLIMLYQTKKFTWKTVGILALMGMTAALTYYSNSRTGQLAIICELLVATVMYLIINKRTAGRFLLFKLLPLAISAAIFVPCTLYLFQIPSIIENKRIQMQAQETTQAAPMETEQEETKATSEEKETEATENKKPTKKPEKDQTKETEKATEPPKKNNIVDLDGFNQTNDEKLNTDGKDLDKFTTRRLTIWKKYLERLNLFGHELGNLVTLKEGGKAYTAHNAWIEYSYSSGVFCGIAYLIFNICAGVLSIIYAWKQKDEKYSLLPLTMAIGYGVIAMVSSVNTPFMYICTMYYTFAQVPIVSKCLSKEK